MSTNNSTSGGPQPVKTPNCQQHTTGTSTSAYGHGCEDCKHLIQSLAAREHSMVTLKDQVRLCGVRIKRLQEKVKTMEGFQKRYAAAIREIDRKIKGIEKMME